ncbi:MAG: hypothetical protein ABL894_09400 [Hyphomicrobium sp.]
MKRRHPLLLAAIVAGSVLSSSVVAQEASSLNDYPTVTRAEYIFGCMQVNGNTRLALERCSCSIDVIASILPHDRYVDAETTMSLRMRGGESVSYMQGPEFVAKVKALKLAQVEGELRCF